MEYILLFCFIPKNQHTNSTFTFFADSKSKAKNQKSYFFLPSLYISLDENM